jgi:hypothetical protein
MKLDRNVNGNGRGKYALLKLRKLDEFTETGDPFQTVAPKIADAIKTLEDAGILDWGIEGTESEFFVIRLKDQFASYALRSYADAARNFDQPEYADEIHELAERSGVRSQFCKLPD